MMIRNFALTFLLVSSTQILWAQDDYQVSRWKLDGVELRYSAASNLIPNLDYDDIYSLVRDKEQFNVDMRDFVETSFSRADFAIERLGVHLTLNKPTKTSHRWFHEWQVGIDVDTFAEVLLEYENIQTNEYLGWCLLNYRISFQASRLIRYSWNKWSAFGGLSTRLTTTFNDEVILFDSEDAASSAMQTKAESVQFLMFYGKLGGAFQLHRRVSLNVAFTYGAGKFMKDFKAEHTVTQALEGSFGVKYHLLNSWN